MHTLRIVRTLCTLELRPMAGLMALNHRIGVRLPAAQLVALLFLSCSSPTVVHEPASVLVRNHTTHVIEVVFTSRDPVVMLPSTKACFSYLVTPNQGIAYATDSAFMYRTEVFSSGSYNWLMTDSTSVLSVLVDSPCG